MIITLTITLGGGLIGRKESILKNVKYIPMNIDTTQNFDEKYYENFTRYWRHRARKLRSRRQIALDKLEKEFQEV